MTSKLHKNRTVPGLDVRSLHHDGVVEWFITVRIQENEAHDYQAVFERATEALAACDNEAQVLHQFVWCPSPAEQAVREAGQKFFRDDVWPLSWIIDKHGQAPFGGCYIHALSGADVQYISVRDRVLAASYTTHVAQYLVIGDLRDEDIQHSPRVQTQTVFADIEQVLQYAHMDFSDVMRTWFYNKNILDWYDDFNQVRTEYFQQHDVFNKVVPASTGIGAENFYDAQLVVSVLAAKSLDDDFSFRAVPSPLQDSAMDYGSSFSRALEYETPDLCHLYVSGSASIDHSGATVYVGDCTLQTKKTLDVIAAILESRNMTWDHVLQAVAYIRYEKDWPIVEQILRERGILDIPLVCTHNVVCRENLLFELELQAAREK